MQHCLHDDDMSAVLTELQLMMDRHQWCADCGWVRLQLLLQTRTIRGPDDWKCLRVRIVHGSNVQNHNNHSIASRRSKHCITVDAVQRLAEHGSVSGVSALRRRAESWVIKSVSVTVCLVLIVISQSASVIPTPAAVPLHTTPAHMLACLTYMSYDTCCDVVTVLCSATSAQLLSRRAASWLAAPKTRTHQEMR